MIRRTNTVVSLNGDPEEAVYITIRAPNGSLAQLFDDSGISKPNPMPATDSTGIYFYNVATAGIYTEEFRFSPGGNARKILSIDLGGSTVPSTLDDLNDVNTSATPPVNGNALVWDSVQEQWEPGIPTGSVVSLDALVDVDTSTLAPTTGQALSWNGDAWVPATVAGLVNVATRTALAAISGPAAGTTRFLAEAGREGTFVYSTTNLSTQVTADTLQGIYVAPAANTTGAAGAWVRQTGAHIRPEWFGGAPQNGVDYLATLNATTAMAALLGLYVQLSPADYYIASTWAITQSRSKVRGTGIHWGGAGTVSRIVIMSPSQYGVILGPSSPPLTGGNLDTNSLNLDMQFTDIQVDRNQAPSIAGNSVGVMVQYCQDAIVRRIKVQEHMVGVAWQGCINARISDCRAYRTLTGAGAGTDYFRAFVPVTPANPVSSINGNASCWMEDCITACTPSLINTVGTLLQGKFCDTFIDNFETAGIRTPVQIEGDGATTNSSSTIIRTNANVRITRLVVDQFADAGVSINNLNKWGSVRIDGDCYFGPSAGAAACVRITASKGAVYIGSGEMAMAVAGSATPGILISGSSKVDIGEGLSIIECNYRGVDISGSDNITVRARFTNETNILNQAIYASGTCLNCDFAPRVSGATGKVGNAVTFAGSAHARNTVSVSAIDSTIVSNKLYYNTAAVTTAGTFGTNNVASGNFA